MDTGTRIDYTPARSSIDLNSFFTIFLNDCTNQKAHNEGIYDTSAKAQGNKITVTFPERVAATDTVKLYFYNYSYLSLTNKADLNKDNPKGDFISHLGVDNVARWDVDNRTGSQLVNCANPAGTTPVTTGGGSTTGGNRGGSSVGGRGGSSSSSRDQHGNNVPTAHKCLP